MPKPKAVQKEPGPGFSALLGLAPGSVEMAVTDALRDGRGHVHLGALLGLADELARSVARKRLRGSGDVVTVDMKTLVCRPQAADLLVGACEIIEESDTSSVWQTTIRDADGHVLAITATTTRLAEDGMSKTPEPTSISEIGLQADGSTRLRSATPATSAQRREQIAAAAADVIAQKGYAAASVREIANAAGMQVPTLYQYVNSKEEVLELVYRWVIERLRADVEEAASKCTTAREKLIAMLTAMIENGHRYRRQVGVVTRELRSLPQRSRRIVLAEYQSFLKRIAEIVEDGIAKGEFRAIEPEIAANLIEILTDVWPLRQFAVARFGLEKVREEVVSFVDAALAAEPAMVRRGARRRARL